MKIEIGKTYKFRGSTEELTYMGENWSGNGYWHQFSKVDKPNIVWAEMITSDLAMLEEA